MSSTSVAQSKSMLVPVSVNNNSEAVSLYADVTLSSVNNQLSLILIHGGDLNLQNSSHWDRHTKFLSQFGNSYAVSLPGHTKSIPAGNNKFAMNLDVHTESILSLMRTDELAAAEEIVLCGRSYGGRVVQNVLARMNQTNDKRFKRVILIAPAIKPDEINAESFQNRELLLVWSPDDPIIPYNRSEEFIKLFPHAKLETITGVVTEQTPADQKRWIGHLPESFQPEKFQIAVKNFLENSK